MYFLGKESKEKLNTIHPDLAKVIRVGILITEADFIVLEGTRSTDRQAKLYKSGASKILASRHLTGHAVDLAAWIDGAVNWDFQYYETIATAIKLSADALSIPIVWGGDWANFRDGAHFQLAWRQYPDIRNKNV